MNVQIDTAIKRARGYWFVDGFIEIAAGILFLLLGGFVLLSMKTPQASFPSWFFSVTGEVVILKVVSFVIVALALWWLKDHFTYPRTGFVRGKITAAQVLAILKNLILFLLLPILGLLALSLLVTSTGSVLSSMAVWFPAGLGLVWGILLILLSEWMGLLRFRWVAALILATGVAVGAWQWLAGLPVIPANVQPTALPPTVVESINRSLTSLGLLLVGSGVVLLISGILTFIRYQMANPQPYTEDI